MIILLWSVVIAGFLVVYHHAIYPIILKAVQKYMLARSASSALKSSKLPSICILIPAYNEAKYIADKLRNLGCIEYPIEKLSIILACDGCTDDTVQIARTTLEEKELQHLPLSIIDYKHNQGKLSLLNKLIPLIDTDVIALSDASALLSIDALLVSGERFNDPIVGAVNGNYCLLNPGSTGEKNYWKYQSAIKQGEEYFGSVLGAHGALYLFRRELFSELPRDTINDDFILPMKIVEAGYRVVYEERMNAVELERSDNQLNWRRRVRIGMGNMQQIIRLRALLHPRYKGISFTFASGKGLRVIMPFLMLYCFLASFVLAALSILYLPFFLAQLFAYLLAASVLFRGEEESDAVSKILFYLVSGHAANLFGSIKYFFNNQRVW